MISSVAHGTRELCRALPENSLVSIRAHMPWTSQAINVKAVTIIQPAVSSAIVRCCKSATMPGTAIMARPSGRASASRSSQSISMRQVIMSAKKYPGVISKAMKANQLAI